jgi:endonuclease/exonuclease/phosphatase family metal-dependent hydrolase
MSRKYLNNISKFIGEQDSVDFILLQEIDEKARRSHHANEVQEIRELMNNSYSVFAKNYHCQFIPVPVYEPMGYVRGGMLTISDFPISKAERHAYPLIASWPNKLFLLDRCFILTRFPLANGKDLVILNTHNSAYVTDKNLRIKELKIITNKMKEEFSKGNYVVAGGDWNANPPGYEPADNYNGHKFFKSEVQMDLNSIPEGWIWAYDNKAPTNRQNYKSFVKGENPTTILDYFVVSPNIELIKAEVIDLNFQDSDHNPIYVKIRLRNN